MCSSSVYTNITGNVVVDLLILMLVGLIFMRLSFPSLYSDYKEIRQEKKTILKILWIILGTISIQWGTFFLGLIIFLASFVSLISKYVC
ncbi:hypothetical protein SAMN05443246_1287 [Paenibacillus sp. GP183]|nr:hypothetical protein SAMN05443246_1287 [Paenibacillus sp. GP183]